FFLIFFFYFTLFPFSHCTINSRSLSGYFVGFSFYYHGVATFFYFSVFSVMPTVNIIIYEQTLTLSDYTSGMVFLPFHLFFSLHVISLFALYAIFMHDTHCG